MSLCNGRRTQASSCTQRLDSELSAAPHFFKIFDSVSHSLAQIPPMSPTDLSDDDHGPRRVPRLSQYLVPYGTRELDKVYRILELARKSLRPIIAIKRLAVTGH